MAILLRSFLLLSILAGPAFARVVRIEIQKQSEVLDGRSFGLAGAYEALTGKAHFAVHPSNSANRIIADIDNAPVNRDGEVEFSAEFYMLRPKDMARANGAVLCDIPNRGNKTMLSMFNLARGSNSPETEAHFGDGFLMRNGYTLLFMGWQFDPPRDNGRLRVYPPTASINGKPIRGLVRADFVVTDRVRHHILSDRNHIPYEVADPQAKENVLTVRDSITAPRRTIPRSKWKFAQVKGGLPVADNAYVYLEDGFEPDKIYEVVYISQDPPEIGSAFGMLVPAIDADGNDRAGIRLPELAVPLATYTGWNVFNAKSGPTRELSSMKGSSIPFARTAAERKATSDPRLSIEERYRNREHYLGLAANAALELVDEGYLLGEDVPEILRRAREHWDYLVEPREAPLDSR